MRVMVLWIHVLVFMLCVDVLCWDDGVRDRCAVLIIRVDGLKELVDHLTCE